MRNKGNPRRKKTLGKKKKTISRPDFRPIPKIFFILGRIDLLTKGGLQGGLKKKKN